MWKAFKNEVEDVEMKNNGEANVKSLFHGTKETPPEKIYMSEEGFNVNYSSNSGMWGRAIYFAFDSSYSHTYASNDQHGFKQMFMAKVIVGNTTIM